MLLQNIILLPTAAYLVLLNVIGNSCKFLESFYRLYFIYICTVALETELWFSIRVIESPYNHLIIVQKARPDCNKTIDAYFGTIT